MEGAVFHDLLDYGAALKNVLVEYDGQEQPQRRFIWGQGLLALALADGTGAAAWLEALEVACQCVAAHRADALVVSLGLDTFGGDPIGGFGLQQGEFARLGARLRRLGLPTAFVLEGGYASAELGHNACHVLEGFEAA